MQSAFGGGAIVLAAPLQRVSSTLEDVRKNGESLLTSASLHLAKFQNESDLLKQLTLNDAKSARTPIKKSFSEANLRRPRFSKALSSAPRETPGRDWLSAFNEKINRAREQTRPKFQLPSRSQVEDQVRFLLLFSLCSQIATYVHTQTHTLSYHRLTRRQNNSFTLPLPSIWNASHPNSWKNLEKH